MWVSCLVVLFVVWSLFSIVLGHWWRFQNPRRIYISLHSSPLIPVSIQQTSETSTSPLLFAMSTRSLLTYNPSSNNYHNTTVMRCKKRGWHPKSECEEDTDTLVMRRFNKLKSDLFKRNGCIPDAQKEIMNRNGSVSGFLRLPPEIRLRIYKLVLGSQRLWIGHNPAQTSIQYGSLQHGKWQPSYPTHCGEEFYHLSTIDRSGRGLDLELLRVYRQALSTVDRSGRGLDLRLLRVCRQVFSETALLPYALNKFTFERDDVRRAFERTTRPGKKLMQKKAIGEYEIMEWREFQAWMLDETEEMAEGIWSENWKLIKSLVQRSSRVYIENNYVSRISVLCPSYHQRFSPCLSFKCHHKHLSPQFSQLHFT